LRDEGADLRDTCMVVVQLPVLGFLRPRGVNLVVDLVLGFGF